MPSRKSQERSEGSKNEEVAQNNESKDVKRHPRLVRSGPCLTPSLCDSEYPINIEKDADDPVIKSLEQLKQMAEAAQSTAETSAAKRTSVESENASTESKASIEAEITEDRRDTVQAVSDLAKLDKPRMMKKDKTSGDPLADVESSANVSLPADQETLGTEPLNAAKDAAHRLSLPLNELIR